MRAEEAEAIVSGYPKLEELLSPGGDGERRRALSILREIAAAPSPSLMRHSVRVLESLFFNHYDDINFDAGSTDVRGLLDRHCVVLVPNHQSHADYMTINYVFYRRHEIPCSWPGGTT